MLEGGTPVGVGVQEVELVLAFECAVVVVTVQDVVRLECGCCYNEVGAGLIEGYRVVRCKDTYVGYDGSIVVIPAVALGRYIYDEAHVEVGLVLEYTYGIFGYLIVEAFGGIVGTWYSGIVLAHGYTLSTAYATAVVDNGLAIDYRDSTVGAMTGAHTTAYTFVFLDAGLRAAVQFELSATTGSSHTEVFQRTAKSGLLVTLEVAHGDNDVGIDYGSAYLGSLAILSIDGYFAVVGSLEAIGNDNGALSRYGVIAILHGTLQVIYGIGTTTGVEGIGVGEEGTTTQRTHDSCHAGCILRTQIGHIARLAKVYLDGGKLILKIDVGNTGLAHYSFHLVDEVALRRGAHIGKIDFGFFHILLIINVWYAVI